MGLSFSELGPIPHAATATDREEVWLDALPHSNTSGERRGEGGYKSTIISKADCDDIDGRATFLKDGAEKGKKLLDRRLQGFVRRLQRS